MAAGVDAVYVGYKSNPQAIPDVQSGLLTFMMIDAINAKVAIDRGALKGLFVTDAERYAAVPGLPTAAEAGYPDLVVTSWSLWAVPTGTPARIKEKLKVATERALKEPDVIASTADRAQAPRAIPTIAMAAITETKVRRRALRYLIATSREKSTRGVYPRAQHLATGKRTSMNIPAVAGTLPRISLCVPLDRPCFSSRSTRRSTGAHRPSSSPPTPPRPPMLRRRGLPAR